MTPFAAPRELGAGATVVVGPCTKGIWEWKRYGDGDSGGQPVLRLAVSPHLPISSVHGGGDGDRAPRSVIAPPSARSVDAGTSVELVSRSPNRDRSTPSGDYPRARTGRAVCGTRKKGSAIFAGSSGIVRPITSSQ